MNQEKCNNCFTGVLGVKGLCECADCEQKYYLSDFVPAIPVGLFSKLTTNEYGSGKSLAESLIRHAELETIAELERAVPSAYGVNKHYESLCSTCNFTSVYTSGNIGQKITVIFQSKMTYLKFTKVMVNTNYTGSATLVIDDGIEQGSVAISLVANTTQEFTIPDYITFSKSVKIYFTNPDIGLSNINCPTKSGCGCGGNNSNAAKWFVLSGFNGSASTTQQYGILPCIEVGCDESQLLCLLASKYKNAVAKYMALNVAIQVYTIQLSSNEQNDATLNMDTETIGKYISTLEAKRHELMYGSVNAYGRGATKGIVHLLEDAAKSVSASDACIVCNSVRYSSTAKF